MGYLQLWYGSETSFKKLDPPMGPKVGAVSFADESNDGAVSAMVLRTGSPLASKKKAYPPGR